jgi:hypothetical protein
MQFFDKVGIFENFKLLKIMKTLARPPGWIKTGSSLS